MFCFVFFCYIIQSIYCIKMRFFIFIHYHDWSIIVGLVQMDEKNWDLVNITVVQFQRVLAAITKNEVMLFVCFLKSCTFLCDHEGGRYVMYTVRLNWSSECYLCLARNGLMSLM